MLCGLGHENDNMVHVKPYLLNILKMTKPVMVD